jgi:hypothetical protein
MTPQEESHHIIGLGNRNLFRYSVETFPLSIAVELMLIVADSEQ